MASYRTERGDREVGRIRAAVRFGAIVVLSAGMVSPALGGEIDRVWAQFEDHLPAYCKYTKLLPDTKHTTGAFLHPLSQGMYHQMFGETWNHLHHYCFGLNDIYKASKEAYNEEMRRGLTRSAIVEFDYVLDRAHQGFVLTPEILVAKGNALVSLDRDLEAVEQFTTALEIRADYVPAYVALANYFERRGDTPYAVTILRQGLERVPDSEILQAKLDELSSRTGAQ